MRLEALPVGKDPGLEVNFRGSAHRRDGNSSSLPPMPISPGKDLGLELEHVAPNAKVSIREGELWEVHGEVGIQSLLFFFLFFVRTPRGG